MTDPIMESIRTEMNARYAQARTEPVELGRVRDYLLSMDEPADGIGPGAVVPPLFLLTLGRTRRPQPSKGSAVKAGDEYEFRLPVRVGDSITVTPRLGDIQVKEGRQGRMYLVISEWTYANQRGETVGVAKTRSFRWGQ